MTLAVHDSDCVALCSVLNASLSCNACVRENRETTRRVEHTSVDTGRTPLSEDGSFRQRARALTLKQDHARPEANWTRACVQWDECKKLETYGRVLRGGASHLSLKDASSSYDVGVLCTAIQVVAEQRGEVVTAQGARRAAARGV